MKQDDFAAALTRLLEPTTVELAEEDTIVPYWAMSAEARGTAPSGPVGADFAPDLAQFLSDGFADETHEPMPSLADIVAYVDGELDGSDREAFEAALVASPELRAEVDRAVRPRGAARVRRRGRGRTGVAGRPARKVLRSAARQEGVDLDREAAGSLEVEGQPAMLLARLLGVEPVRREPGVNRVDLVGAVADEADVEDLRGRSRP